MRHDYAYGALCQKTPKEIEDLLIVVRNEHSLFLQAHHHENCASILFYQSEIRKLNPPKGQNE